MIGRTSSESFGTVWLFFCLGYMAKTFTSKRNEGAIQHLVCGAFCALMFYSRLQMGFVYAAIGIWLLVVRRSRPLHLIANVSGFLIIAAACTALDSWLYGDLVLTPFRYFKSNILEGVASNFGVSPWYGYFVEFNSTFRAITGGLSFISMAALIWKKPKSILAWIFWAFVIGHSLVAHKEERFLFPVLMLAPMSWAYGVEVLGNFLQRLGVSVINRTSICYFLIIANCLVGLIWATRPFKRYGMLEELDTEARRNRQTV
jgi:phosphatidylinositol glycan class B